MKDRINNERFSIRLCLVADVYGFKTVGKMYNALKQAKPHAKWSFNDTYVRNASLIREIEEYMNSK